MSHRRKSRFKLKSLYVWHRYVGVTAALLVILLALTGIPLNHTERLALDNRYVGNSWLLDWYGIEAPKAAQSFATTRGAVTLLGSQLYLGRAPVAGNYHRLQGAVELDGFLAVAADEHLLLLTPEAEVIERLGVDAGLPAGIARIGVDNAGRLVAEAAEETFVADADVVRWQRLDDSARAGVNWARPAPLDDAERAVLAQHYRASILPYERVLLDLHSGRILGHYGPWLMDTAAVLMLFLAGSGLFIWARRKR